MRGRWAEAWLGGLLVVKMQIKSIEELFSIILKPGPALLFAVEHLIDTDIFPATMRLFTFDGKENRKFSPFPFLVKPTFAFVQFNVSAALETD